MEVVGSDDESSTLNGVVEAFDGHTVTVALRRSDHPVEVTEGASLRVRYHDENGLYRFETTVVDVRRGDPDAITVEVPDHVELEQRRRHVRVETEMVVAGAALDREVMVFTPVTGTVENLSGGGLRMVAEPAEVLAEGTAITIALRLPGQPPVLAMGTVVARLPAEAESVDARVAFSLIEGHDRERLLRWLIQQLQAGQAGQGGAGD